MEKLFYKFLIWLCNRSIARADELHNKHTKKMENCLEVIAALMEKSIELENAFKANITLSINYLPVCLDIAKEAIDLENAIKEGNGFLSRMDKIVEINENHYERTMKLVNSGANLSRMKHELEVAMFFTYREYFISQSKVVNLCHMRSILTVKKDKFQAICNG